MRFSNALNLPLISCRHIYVLLLYSLYRDVFISDLRTKSKNVTVKMKHGNTIVTSTGKSMKSIK